MNLTTNNSFTSNTKKSLQQNFLDLIKENVISDLKDEGLQLNYKDYDNIEKTIIESFNQKVKNNNVKKITDVEDVTLDDIMTIKESNDDGYIEDLTETKTFDKLYKYITESQKPQEVKKVIKEQESKEVKEPIKESKSNKNIKELTNRRSKTKMSIIDRKKRKQIKESLNRIEQKRRKKNLKESVPGDGGFELPYHLDELLKEDPYYNFADPKNDRHLDALRAHLRNIDKNENVDEDELNEQEEYSDNEREPEWRRLEREKDQEYSNSSGEGPGNDKDRQYESEDDENEINFESVNNNKKVLRKQRILKKKLKEQFELFEQDDDEDVMDDIFDEEPKKDKKQDKPEDKQDDKLPKDDSKPEPKKDKPNFDKEPKQNKDDKDSKDSDKQKEDELLKKVKEMKPELKSKDLKIKMGKQLSEPKGFTFEVTDDKNKQVSNFVVIETGPKEEAKQEKPEDKISGKVEESLTEQDTNNIDEMTIGEFISKYPEQEDKLDLHSMYSEYVDKSNENDEGNYDTNKFTYEKDFMNVKIGQDSGLSKEDKNKLKSVLNESVNKRRKRRLKEQSLDDTVKKIAEEKTNETMDEIYNAVQEFISSQDILGKQTRTQGQQQEEDVEPSEGETPELDTENNEVPNKQQNTSGQSGTQEKPTKEDEQTPNEDGQDESKDVSLNELDYLFGGKDDQVEKESEDFEDIFGETENELDDMIFNGEDEYQEDFDLDELFKNETVNKETEDYLKESVFRLFDINPTKKQVDKVTSPKDYGPKGQERTSSIFPNKTRDYVGDQTMKFPTENPKQKQKEKSMEKLMTDLDKIF